MAPTLPNFPGRVNKEYQTSLLNLDSRSTTSKGKTQEYNHVHFINIHRWPNGGKYDLLNWAHRSVDKHTTHKIDHTIYLAIEEWNSAKRLATVNVFINQKVIR